MGETAVSSSVGDACVGIVEGISVRWATAGVVGETAVSRSVRVGIVCVGTSGGASAAAIARWTAAGVAGGAETAVCDSVGDTCVGIVGDISVRWTAAGAVGETAVCGTVRVGIVCVGAFGAVSAAAMAR